MAAGTVTVAESGSGTVKKVVFSWTAGTAGDAGTASGSTTKPYDGEILGLTTIPGTDAAQPDDNYGVTVTDSGGHDVLLGAGASRDETNTEHVARASLAAVASSILTVNVTSAGASTTGTVIVYLR
jgi:hypothetical protein